MTSVQQLIERKEGMRRKCNDEWTQKNQGNLLMNLQYGASSRIFHAAETPTRNSSARGIADSRALIGTDHRQTPSAVQPLAKNRRISFMFCLHRGLNEIKMLGHICKNRRGASSCLQTSLFNMREVKWPCSVFAFSHLPKCFIPKRLHSFCSSFALPYYQCC